MSDAGAEAEQTTTSPDQTEAVGAEIAATLAPGDVVAVSGSLGAGKTTLIRGACRALGVEGPVVSPTFTIGRLLRGRLLVAHVDLYRLDDLGGEEPGLLDDYLRPDAVAFVEWPERGSGELGRVTVEVAIETAGPEARRVRWSRGR